MKLINNALSIKFNKQFPRFTGVKHIKDVRCPALPGKSIFTHFEFMTFSLKYYACALCYMWFWLWVCKAIYIYDADACKTFTEGTQSHLLFITTQGRARTTANGWFCRLVCVYGIVGLIRTTPSAEMVLWPNGQVHVTWFRSSLVVYITPTIGMRSGGSVFECLLSSPRLHRSVVDDMCDNRVWCRAWEVELYCRRSYGGFSLRIFRVRDLRHSNTHMVAVAYDTTTGCLA